MQGMISQGMNIRSKMTVMLNKREYFLTGMREASFVCCSAQQCHEPSGYIIPIVDFAHLFCFSSGRCQILNGY